MDMFVVKYNFMNDKDSVLTSVLGFDMDSSVTYIDEIGDEKELCKGFKSIPYTGDEIPKIGTIIPFSYHKFFTNFNQELLDKIRDHKSKYT